MELPKNPLFPQRSNGFILEGFHVLDPLGGPGKGVKGLLFRVYFGVCGIGLRAKVWGLGFNGSGFRGWRSTTSRVGVSFQRLENQVQKQMEIGTS